MGIRWDAGCILPLKPDVDEPHLEQQHRPTVGGWVNALVMFYRGMEPTLARPTMAVCMLEILRTS